MKRMTIRLLKSLVILSAIFVFVPLNLLISSEARAQQPIKVNVSSPAAEKQPCHIVLQKMCDRITQRSSGRVTFKLYPSNSLYGPRAAIEALISGALEIAMISNGNLAAFSYTLNFNDLPFLFETREHLSRILLGPLAKRINAQVEKESGVKVLYNGLAGTWRQLYTTRKEVRVPEDIRRLKLRTTTSPVEQAIVRAYGALPTFVDWGEVYTAFKQGVVDGYFGHANWIIYTKQDEVLRYCVWAPFHALVEPVMISPKFFNLLPADLQKVFEEEAGKALIESIEVDKEDVKAAEEHLIKVSKMKLYYPTEKEMAQWREYGMKAWNDPEVKKTVDWDLVNEIKKLKP